MHLFPLPEQIILQVHLDDVSQHLRHVPTIYVIVFNDAMYVFVAQGDLLDARNLLPLPANTQ